MKKYLLSLAIIPFAVVAVFFIIHREVVVASSSLHWATTDIFTNYTTWRKTITSYSANTTLALMANYNDTLFPATPNKFTFTDINGDNLPDFLYHEKVGSTADNTSASTQFYAVFLNNGNYNFNLAYKCVSQYDTSLGKYNSYGDCGGTKITDPNSPANQNMYSQVMTLANFYRGTEPNPRTHLLLDMNGDGLPDFIGSDMYANNGQSLFPFL